MQTRPNYQPQTLPNYQMQTRPYQMQTRPNTSFEDTLLNSSDPNTSLMDMLLNSSEPTSFLPSQNQPSVGFVEGLVDIHAPENSGSLWFCFVVDTLKTSGTGGVFG